MNGDAPRLGLELRMTERMVDSAYALGERLARAALAEADARKLLTLTDGFHRCFHAVRMGIRLCLTLRAPPKSAAASASEPRAERDREALRDRPDREYDRDRDRDDEPVGAGRFLATLRGVAKDAERLGVAAEEAAHLRTLLAEADAAPASVAVKPRPATSPSRARYLNSTAPPLFKPAHPRQSGDPGFFR